MYTKEDFLRDYPPTEDAPFLFGWQIEAFTQKNREQGQEKGHAAAQSMLEQLLVRRFGPISDALRAQLHAYTLDQLQALVNPALDAADLDAFAAQIPADAHGDEKAAN